MITVYHGPMFARKTARAFIEMERHERAGRRTGLFKPKRDSRNPGDELESHDKVKKSAITVATFAEVLQCAGDYDVIVYEEGQFDQGKLLEPALELSRMGKIVYVPVLDYNFKCEPFSRVWELIDSPHTVKIQCVAVCVEKGCGAEARWSEYIGKGDQDDDYHPGFDFRAVCTKHHPHWRKLLGLT